MRMTPRVSLLLLVCVCSFANGFGAVLERQKRGPFSETYYGIANDLANPEYRGKFVRVDFYSDGAREACERLGLRSRHDLTWDYFESWHRMPYRDIKKGNLGPGIDDFRVFDLPYDLANWMSRLKEETRLTALALPGSHDSGSAQPELVSNPVRTQEFSILIQLLLGVRVFDIRPTRAGGEEGDWGRNDGSIWTYHGEVMGNGIKTENLVRALNCVRMFLERYPSEVVVFKLSHYLRVSEAEVVADMSRILGQRFLNPPAREAKEALHVHEARGKVLFLPEQHAERNLGPNGHDGTNDWNRMKAHLDTIPERRSHYNRFVVALTCQGAFDKRPEELALKRGLPGLRDWLNTQESDKIGIVEADYFGSPKDILSIINLIVEKNRRLGFMKN